MANTKPLASQVRYGRNSSTDVSSTLKSTILIYATKELADEASVNYPDGQIVDVEDTQKRYSVQAGLLVFESYLSNTETIPDYAAFSTYAGSVKVINISAPGISGTFDLISGDTTTLENGVTRFRDSLGRLWERQYTGRLNPRWAGVVGDYSTDDTEAFIKITAISAQLNQDVDYSGLNVRIIGSHDIPLNAGFYADKSHSINTWLNTPDKLNMRPGRKHLVSGGNIWISGPSRSSYTTNRVDRYASFTYGLKYTHLQALRWQGVGLILDVDIYNEGGVLTNRANDNQSHCDVGLLLRGYATKGRLVNFFGYWGIASLAIHSQQDLENVDSDYCGFSDSRFTGISLIGDHTGANGLTGSSWPNCEYYNSSDYHVRSEGNYSNSAIYVDGPVTGATGIRGHRFDGILRTYANKAIDLDHCRDIVLNIHCAETPILAGVSGADTQGNIVGTLNTRAVYIGPYSASANGLGVNALATTIAGPLISIGGPDGRDMMTAVDGRIIRTSVEPATGDQLIQFTEDLTDYNTGLVLRRDADQAGRLSIRFDGEEKARIEPTGNIQADGGLSFNGSATSVAGEIDLRSGGADQNVRLRNGANTVALFGSTNTVFYANVVRPNSDGTATLGAPTFRWGPVYSVSFRPGAGNVIWTSGSGTPEGVVVAPVGSMYTRTDGSTGTTLYIKESGVGNTGWVAK